MIELIKKNIRTSVFETNSSSSHSISLNEDNILVDISLIPDEDGVIRLVGGEFGWEWITYNDALTKANYASIETSGVNRELLANAIKEQTGAKDVMFLSSLNYDSPYHSYIDHESTGLLSDINTIEKMKNWLFNPNTWLITGNDNSDAPFNLLDFPIYDKEGNVHDYVYKYELKIEGIDDIVKLGENFSNQNLIEAIEYLTSDISFSKNYGVFKNLSWNRKENTDYFYARSYEIDSYIDFIDVENKTFTAFSSSKLSLDIDELIKYEKQKKFDRKIVTEKKEKEQTESAWMIRSRIEKTLKEKDIEKYIIRIGYELVEL